MQIMKNLILVFFCLTIQQAFSQETLDELYIPKEGSFFDSESSPGEVSNSGYVTYKHAIKAMPFLIPKGILAAHYEYTISDEFSLLMGIGTQYFNNAFLDLSLIGTEISIPINESQYIYGYDLSNIDGNAIFIPGINLFFNPGFRFNYESIWGYDEAYFQVDYRYTSFKKEYFHNYESNDFNDLRTESFDVNIRSASINFISGLKFTSGGRVSFVNELYYGFGINFFSHNDLEPESNINNGIIGGSSNQNLQLSSNRVRYIGYSILVGYNVGIGWK